jgi:hypothetical protein
MYDGTLATKGPWQALVTFQQMIVLCNRSGEVDMTAEAIARRTTVPLEIIQVGIEALEQPDPESRTPDLDGRRIIRLSEFRSWGWRIVNYEHYRKIRSDEERNAYQRDLMRKRRAVSKTVSNVSEVSTCSKQYAVSSKQEREEAPPAIKEKIKVPTDAHSALAAKLGVDCQTEFLKYRDWLAANGKHHKSEVAGFNNWLRRAVEFKPKITEPARHGSHVPARIPEMGPHTEMPDAVRATIAKLRGVA